MVEEEAPGEEVFDGEDEEEYYGGEEAAAAQAFMGQSHAAQLIQPMLDQEANMFGIA